MESLNVTIQTDSSTGIVNLGTDDSTGTITIGADARDIVIKSNSISIDSSNTDASGTIDIGTDASGEGLITIGNANRDILITSMDGDVIKTNETGVIEIGNSGIDINMATRNIAFEGTDITIGGDTDGLGLITIGNTNRNVRIDTDMYTMYSTYLDTLTTSTITDSPIKTFPNSSSPKFNNYRMAISKYGKYIIAAHGQSTGTTPLHFSNDFGATWTNIAVYGIIDTASSSSGEYQYIAASLNPKLYRYNRGVRIQDTTSFADVSNVFSVATSSSGQIVYASTANPFKLRKSTDYGITFSDIYDSGTSAFIFITTDRTGQYIAAIQNNHATVRISSDSGNSFGFASLASFGTDIRFKRIRMSADGKYIVIVGFDDGAGDVVKIFVSNNYGVSGSWTAESLPITVTTNTVYYYDDITMSSDGKYVILTVGDNAYVSDNYGYTGSYSKLTFTVGLEASIVALSEDGKWAYFGDNTITARFYRVEALFGRKTVLQSSYQTRIDCEQELYIGTDASGAGILTIGHDDRDIVIKSNSISIDSSNTDASGTIDIGTDASGTGLITIGNANRDILITSMDGDVIKTNETGIIEFGNTVSKIVINSTIEQSTISLQPAKYNPRSYEVGITASDAATSDYFGYFVAISADGNTAIVGAFAEDPSAISNAGSAYIFVRDGTTWTQQQKIWANDAGANDLFGSSGSISADGNTAIVGAPEDDVSGTNSGSAYIFVRDGTTWTQQQKIWANDADATDLFGTAVSISADGNTVTVGAIHEDASGTDSGSIYIFVRIGTAWTQQQKIWANDASSYIRLGGSISISADGNTIIVGIRSDGTYWSGSAYIFVRDGETWAQQQKILADDTGPADNFGYSVAINYDGSTAVVCAVFGAAPSISDCGSAYIFVKDGVTWTQQQKIFTDNPIWNDQFGSSVAISPDGNTVVVGARNKNVSGISMGSVYTFCRNGTTWTQQQHIIASDGQSTNSFGNSVAISSGGTIIAGANKKNTNTGKAYIYTKSNNEIDNTISLYNNTWYNLGNILSVDIDGGTIDNVQIGNFVPTTAKLTTLSHTYKTITDSDLTVDGSDNVLDVAGYSMIAIDASNNITIDALTGGTEGQVLEFVITTPGTITFTHIGTTNQSMYLNGAVDYIPTSYGGIRLFCNGTDWYEVSRS